MAWCFGDDAIVHINHELLMFRRLSLSLSFPKRYMFCDSGLLLVDGEGPVKRRDLIVVSSCYSCMIDQNKQVLSQDSCSAEWTSIRGK